MEQQTKTNLLNVHTWIRLLYMVLFGVLSVVARMVIWVVCHLAIYSAARDGRW